MNDNFTYLEGLANQAKLDFSAKTVNIDCSADAQALRTYLLSVQPSQFAKVKLTGVCEGDSKGELAITRSDIWIEGGEISAQVLVRGKQDVSFADVSFTSNLKPEFWIDGGGSAYLQNPVFTAGANPVVTANSALAYRGDVTGINFYANQASRPFFFSPTGTASSVRLEIGAAMEFGGLTTTSLDANTGGSLKGTSLTADYININNGASGMVETIVANEELILKGNGALFAGNMTGKNLNVMQSSSLKTTGDVTGTELFVSYGASARIKGNATVTDFHVGSTSSARIDEKLTSTNVSVVEGSTLRTKNLAVNNNLFVRRATVKVDDEISYTTVDAGSYSDLYLNMSLSKMCADFNPAAVMAWSTLDSQSFPENCSN
ncbi:hypothetical protein [Vibrio tapetis]|uniref:Uncharacterized protein n=1 Tax=Vibrio tapetis subsp. tapetis TaxID=1671868 RepID=A0A2N8ZMK3_9VIBR|nr:hypothetical protein [Vibrio tapetis]SON53107.1 protein of unknown function [Vibrio tapetis subsp. tapetis]